MSRRKRRSTPPDPQPWLRLLSPELRDNPRSIAWAKATLQEREYEREFKCTTVDFYELYKVCPGRGCRRARRCVNPDLPCYEAILPWLRQNVFPTLLPIARRMEAEREAALRPESPL